MTYEIIHADVLEALKKMPDASVDSVLTDPPYGLGTKEPTLDEIIAYLTGARLDTGGDFMGKEWELPPIEVWREVMRVLRPGGHLIAFGGSRMFDLLVIGVRAAGFEIRDELAWIYGQGYGKSKRIERAISMERCKLPGRHFEATLPKGKKAKDGDHLCPVHPDGEKWIGYGTGLKPSYEPVVLARKPLADTYADSALTHGTGGLNIDGARIGYSSEADRKSMSDGVDAIRERGGVMNNSWKNSNDLSGANPANPLGRWPSNVAIGHTDNCLYVGTKTERGHKGYTNGPGGTSSQFSQKGTPTTRTEAWAGHPDAETDAYECVPECPVRQLDEQSGVRPGMTGGGVHSADYGGGMFGSIDSKTTARADSGGASRFFYVAKASRNEREFGCDELPTRTGAEAVEREEDSAGVNNPRAGAGRTAEEVHNHHPTVKPIKIDRILASFLRWLATLLLPPPLPRPRRLLVLYSGSGSEMVGALRAGWDEVVGIEREAEYVEIAKARLARWSQVPIKMTEAEAVGEARTEGKKVLKGQQGLF